MKRIISALSVAVMLMITAVIALPGVASAHTPSVGTTCQALSVNLTNYRVKAEHPETTHTEYTRWSYTPKHQEPGASTPLTDPDHWQVDNKPDPKDDPIGEAFFSGKPWSDSWFFWTSEEVSNNDYSPAKVNHVTVTVNDVVVADTDFNQSYTNTFAFLPNQTNTYKVAVTAWDDTNGSHGWSFVKSGSVEGCSVPKPADLTKTEKWDNIPACVEPFGGTATVETWAQDYTQTHIWSGQQWVPSGEWVKDGDAYLVSTKTIDREECVPQAPEPKTGTEYWTNDLVCADPLNGTGTIETWAKDWTQDSAWDWETHDYVLGDKVYGAPYLVSTETVTDESCIPDAPKPLTGQDVRTETSCVIPLNGTSVTAKYVYNWHIDPVWNAGTGKWDDGTAKVYDGVLVYDGKPVADSDCAATPPVTPPTQTPTLRTTPERLAETGAAGTTGALTAAGLLMTIGAGLIVFARRKRT